MKTIQIKLTLQEPLVISQSNATEGAHQSLDYLPGATLLGAMAAKHYADLKKAGLAYDVFHSGKVRFQNAFPFFAGSQSNPTPLSFHYDKLGNKLEPLNYLHKHFTDGKQGKQHRTGYIVNHQQDLFIYEPSKTLQMRTAIDAKKGTAQEGQLFGYQTLKAGECFLAKIDCDTDDLEVTLRSILNKQKEILIGRSRSAQYGRVALEVLPDAENAIQEPVIKLQNQQKETKNHLVLWLASDMAIYNQYGQPTLSPTLQELGLSAQGTFVSEKSFVRTRQYAPYNGFRRSYDLQRQVLEKGSILTYQLNEALSDTDLQTLAQGLGAYTESGLGQVVLDGAIKQLKDSDPKLTEWEETKKDSNHQVDSKPTDLINYLNQQHAQTIESSENSIKIDEELQQLIKLYQSARKYNGAQKGTVCGPTKTQWGMIRQSATNTKGSSQLMEVLFDSNNGLVKGNDEHWSISTGSNSFYAYLVSLTEAHTPTFIRGLAFKVTQNQTLLNLMEGKA